MSSISQDDSCFIKAESEQVICKQAPSLNDVFCSVIRKIPGNQLRTINRPHNLVPRTLFIHQPFQILPNLLNEHCIEPVIQTIKGRSNLKINNTENASLQQFFMKNYYSCIYNKFKYHKHQTLEFTGKLKNLDLYNDYNEKLFKQLQVQNVQKTEGFSIDSQFQCGNICLCYCHLDNPYCIYLLIQNDINSHGYNNWFFFRMRNAESQHTYQFVIMNLVKQTTSYRQGQLISVFSQEKYHHQGLKWHKTGNKVFSTQTNFKRANKQSYYSLSFEYEVQYEKDQIYFANSQPYTYSRLAKYIESIKQIDNTENNEEEEKPYVQVQELAYSLSNNIVPGIKISLKNKENKKQTILILGRQHPNETVGSFIVENIMQYLLQGAAQVTFLLQRYNFYIIPMVNPDGVIHGTSRCNLAGLDLNRQWGPFILKQLTPETFRLSSFINCLHQRQNIRYMIDVHGHGKKLNSFFFSCKRKDRLSYRMMSMAMKKLQPRFNIFGCTYGITKDKQNTIRSQLFQMGVSNCYTLENSLYGWNQGDQIKHYNEQDYRSIARSLVKSIFVMQAPNNEIYNILGFTKETLQYELAQVIDQIEIEQNKNYNDNQVLSDSDPQGDILNIQERVTTCTQDTLLRKKMKTSVQNARRVSTSKKKKQSKINLKDDKTMFKDQSLRNSCPQAGDYVFNETILQPKQQQYNQKKIGIMVMKAKKPSSKIRLKQRKYKKNKKNQQKSKIQDNTNQRKTLTTFEMFSENNSKKPKKNVQIKKTVYSLYPTSGCIIYEDKNSKIIQKDKIKKQSNDFLFIKNAQTINPSVYEHRKLSKQIPIQIEEKINDIKNPIQHTIVPKNYLQIKYSQLKEESLNVLLKDTLSICKFKTKTEQAADLKRAHTQKNQINTKQRRKRFKSEKMSSAIYSVDGMKINYSQRNHALKSSDKVKQFRNKRQSTKYDRFENFQQNNRTDYKSTKFQNSVFYYFPIL